MTDAEFQNRLAEYEDMVRLLTAKLEDLAAENTRLRSEKSDALSVCKEVYSDPGAPPALRLKAAGLALPHEAPRLAPVEAPLELTAEPCEPLADVIARQRARADQMLLTDPRYRDLPNFPSRPSGDGNDSDSGSND
jgi:hypothetical protein